MSLLYASILMMAIMISSVGSEIIAEIFSFELRSYIITFSCVFVGLATLSLIMSILSIILYVSGKRRKLDLVVLLLSIIPIIIVYGNSI